MSQEKTTLGYWGIRGLAQPIRLLLNYVGEEFIDFKYTVGPAPDFIRQGWLDAKAKLTDIPFTNLPYYIDGDIKIAQSNAIIRYLGRKYNLLGETEQEILWLDIIENQCVDFRNVCARMCYDPDFENLLPDYLKNLPAKLQAFEDFLGENLWFTGQKITTVDFMMYETFDQHRTLSPECLSAFPKLCAYLDRFEALPSIKKYMSSSGFLKRPINDVTAMFK